MKKQTKTNAKAETSVQSDTNNIAVVDVQTIVNSSAQVKALKEEQAAKVQEFNAWVQNVQAEIRAVEDKAQQEALLQQYNAVFAQKKNELALNYQQKLKVVSDSISQTVAEEAKQKGYPLVLAKNIVIFGGIDITEEIAKNVK